MCWVTPLIRELFNNNRKDKTCFYVVPNLVVAFLQPDVNYTFTRMQNTLDLIIKEHRIIDSQKTYTPRDRF